MPARRGVVANDTAGTSPTTRFLLGPSSRSKAFKKGQPRQTRSCSVHGPSKKKQFGGDHKLSERLFSMNCLPMLTKAWRKKRATSDASEDEAIWDPLAAIIEEAKNVTGAQRVRLVRFNLDENTTEASSRSSSRLCGLQRPSILHTNSTSSIIKSVILDQGPNYKDAAPKKSRIQSPFSDGNDTSSSTTFKEEKLVTVQIKKFIKHGQKFQSKYNYPKAAKLYLGAMALLNENSYPIDHILRQEAHQSIHNTHHAHKNLEHSANIVKIGLGLEVKGHLLKALKMYTVAFRIRKESLGSYHPSLPVLLNLLGAVQVKRGQHDEAMQIFEVALYGKARGNHSSSKRGKNKRKAVNAFTLAVSMREIGAIHEHFGRLEEAMSMYHDSLDCILKDSKEVESGEYKQEKGIKKKSDNVRPPSPCSTVPSEESYDVCVVSASSSSSHADSVEEMEIYLQENLSGDFRTSTNLVFFYDSFFQITDMKSRKINIHVTTTLHSIANIHRKQHEYNFALSCYHASLRGMKLVHGEKHQNVAAVLGNIGNLLKDMKDYDRAFDIYQSVLKIESLRLGYSHHDVMISMLNIAMIEKCRERHEESIAMYKEVIKIQESRQNVNGKRLNVLAVAHSHLGDVNEKIGRFADAIDAYKESLTIRSKALEGVHPDLGQILYKLGLLCSKDEQYRHADAYFSKALSLYMNINVEDERVVRVQRDKADNQMKLALMPKNGLSIL
eukprot:scaffold1149_cov188-Chaetoceros_neogracile.AAC.2